VRLPGNGNGVGVKSAGSHPCRSANGPGMLGARRTDPGQAALVFKSRRHHRPLPTRNVGHPAGVARTARRRFVVLAAHERKTLREIERQFIDDPEFRRSSDDIGQPSPYSLRWAVCGAARQLLERPS
jgi:hypothetical protein